MITTSSLALVQRSEEGRSITVAPQEEVTVKVASHQTNYSYCVLELTAGPNVSPPLHLHQREDEIFEILDGRFLFSLDGKIVEVSPGTTVVVPRNMPHSWRNISDSPGRMMLIFIPGGIDELFEAMASIPTSDPAFPQLAERHGTLVLGPPLKVEGITGIADQE